MFAALAMAALVAAWGAFSILVRDENQRRVMHAWGIGPEAVLRFLGALMRHTGHDSYELTREALMREHTSPALFHRRDRATVVAVRRTVG